MRTYYKKKELVERITSMLPERKQFRIGFVKDKTSYFGTKRFPPGEMLLTFTDEKDVLNAVNSIEGWLCENGYVPAQGVFEYLFTIEE